jgi:hypothetical protein
MILTLIMIVLFVLLAIGTPVGFAMAGSGVLGLYLIGGMAMLTGILQTAPLSAVTSYELITIPMFLLMAEFVLVSAELVHYTVSDDQIVDCIAVEAGIEENRAAIRSDIRRGPQLVLGKAHEARRARRVYQTNTGRFLAHRGFRCFDVNIMQPIAGIEDSLGDNVRRMKPVKPRFGRVSQKNIAHLRDQGIRRVRALCEIQEPRIAGKIFAFDGGAKAFILRLIHQSDHEPAILCLIGARRYIERARCASL